MLQGMGPESLKRGLRKSLIRFGEDIRGPEQLQRGNISCTECVLCGQLGPYIEDNPFPRIGLK